jgi:tRNA (adenine57-N1/adenine58-N1)-methyltransferase catalytic subunit
VAAAPFVQGEIVLLVDKAQNRRLIRLRSGAKAHGHRGFLEHDRIIGADEGVVVRSSSGARYLVFRPRLSEYALEMPRKSAIVYPKDVGIILVWADIFPGATVVEAGLGSGSLTLALLRAVGPTGQVICYEQRADMIPPALTNIRAYSLPGASPDLTLDWPPKPHAPPASASADDTADDGGAEEPREPIVATGPSNLLVRERDITTGIDERDVDRLVLDLPEPWRVLPHALEALRPGGVIACYSPSIVQVQRTIEELEATRGFAQIEPLEVLYRPWHVKGQAVRPVQQMVSHTAFLTFARRLAVRGQTGSNDALGPDDGDDVFIDAAADDVPVPGADPD